MSGQIILIDQVVMHDERQWYKYDILTCYSSSLLILQASRVSLPCQVCLVYGLWEANRRLKMVHEFNEKVRAMDEIVQ